MKLGSLYKSLLQMGKYDTIINVLFGRRLAVSEEAVCWSMIVAFCGPITEEVVVTQMFWLPSRSMAMHLERAKVRSAHGEGVQSAPIFIVGMQSSETLSASRC